jgi:hypothetical protein
MCSKELTNDSMAGLGLPQLGSVRAVPCRRLSVHHALHDAVDAHLGGAGDMGLVKYALHHIPHHVLHYAVDAQLVEQGDMTSVGMPCDSAAKLDMRHNRGSACYQ